MQSISPPEFSLDFPYAYGEPAARASFRVEPEDFQVDEMVANQGRKYCSKECSDNGRGFKNLIKIK